MLLAMNTNTPSHAPARHACCPTCHTRTEFRFAGEQHWPRRVAEAAGLDPVVRLWNCEHCHTTISECDLKQ